MAMPIYPCYTKLLRRKAIFMSGYATSHNSCVSGFATLHPNFAPLCSAKLQIHIKTNRSPFWRFKISDNMRWQEGYRNWFIIINAFNHHQNKKLKTKNI